MRRILLATDGSVHSLRAARLAGEMSAALDVPVDVLNVVPDGTISVPTPVQDYARIESVAITQRELLHSLGNDLVARAAEAVGEAGGRVGVAEVRIGSPAQEIVRFAESRESDCIVMGRRGLGDVAGLFLGSVSHKVGHLTSRTLITSE